MTLIDPLLSPVHHAQKVAKDLQATAVPRDLEAGRPELEIQKLREAQLLDLVVPAEYGGQGASWLQAFQVTRELSKTDGSLGQLYGNHLVLSALAHVAGNQEQQERYHRGTAEHQWFWANAINTRDTRLRIESKDGKYLVNGEKSFGTGVALGDQRVFSAVQPGLEEPLLFVIPKNRVGVQVREDWDHFGQRRTDSGTVVFTEVDVYPDEILTSDHPGSPFTTFLGIIAQILKTYTFLGIAEGALEAAQAFTRENSRPWVTSGVDSASKDPYILQRHGELWVELQGALALADRAGVQVQQVWHREFTLSEEQRGEVAVAVFAAKALATRVGLKITSEIFESLGPRATHTRYGFDRYWRDLRTLTLHDPVDYKLRDVGAFVLNHTLPPVTQYS